MGVRDSEECTPSVVSRVGGYEKIGRRATVAVAPDVEGDVVLFDGFCAAEVFKIAETLFRRPASVLEPYWKMRGIGFKRCRPERR